jgi:hypothetical protein
MKRRQILGAVATTGLTVGAASLLAWSNNGLRADLPPIVFGVGVGVTLLGGITHVWLFVSAKSRDANPKTVPQPATLAVDTNGIIDARDAVIPGDLPFPFAKASGGGMISMSGIVVVDKGNSTFEVRPGGVPPRD